MPKGRSRKGGLDKTVLVPFRVLYRFEWPNTAATLVNQIDLKCSALGARIVAISPSYEWFRFKKLSAYSHTTCANSGQSGGGFGSNSFQYGIAYVDSNTIVTGTPTSVAQVSQYEKFKMGGPYSSLRLRISLAEMQALPYKWYNTEATGAPTDAISAGMFIVVQDMIYPPGTTQNPSVNLVIEGVIEFRGMITPALSFDAPVKAPGSKAESDSDDELFTVLSEIPVDPYNAVENPLNEHTRRMAEAMAFIKAARTGKRMLTGKQSGVSAGGTGSGPSTAGSNVDAKKPQ